MNRIKYLRTQNAWTQEELAKMLSVQNAAISKYETGRVPLTDETLKKLSKIFNCSADYILGISDDPTPPNQKKQSEHDVFVDEVLKTLPNPTDEEFEKLIDYARYIVSLRKK